MKIINWIREQLDYRRKYNAMLDQDREAARNALVAMGQYEHLRANLPYDHELSTKKHWQDYADNRLLLENRCLKKDLEHVQSNLTAMITQWRQNIIEYGKGMYGDWQPIDTAPKDGTRMLAWFADGGHSIIYWGSYDKSWVQALPGLGSDSGYSPDTFSHWMPLPEPPK
jgi:hypothetical protein